MWTKLQAGFEIVRAKKEEMPGALSLLKSSGLTLEGVEDTEFWIAKSGERIIGTVGLETWGDQGLLRSLAVDKELRNLGIGRALVLHVIELAKNKKLKELFLITEAVQNYYLKFGFELVERNKISGNVLNSQEFRGACLESANVMRWLPERML